MKKPLILLLLITLTSCSSILLNFEFEKYGILNTKNKLSILKSEKQELIFIGMNHIGRKEFYDDVAYKIDSLQKLGYTVFYEGVTDGKEIDSTTTAISNMKLRKLIGFYPSQHIDTTTNIIEGKIKYKGAYKLVNQPKYNELKIDSLTAINADVGTTELITEFEKNYTEIKLDSCDFKTKLKDRNYKCKKVKKRLYKKFMKEYVNDYRNDHLANTILKSGNNKIVVVYGKGHFWELYFRLIASDKSYIKEKYKGITPRT